MKRLIFLVLGLLMLTGCTEQLEAASQQQTSTQTALTYGQVYQVLKDLKESDAIAKDEKRKVGELPRDSTAFNLTPISDSPLSRARKKCKKLLGEYNKAAKQYNALPAPRKGAPKEDPNFVVVTLGNTENLSTPDLPFTCGEDLP